MGACRLFWHGYLLGDRSPGGSLLEECKGVKAGEELARDESSLTVFLTVNADDGSDSDGDGADFNRNRSRNNSFEMRLRKGRRETCAMS